LPGGAIAALKPVTRDEGFLHCSRRRQGAEALDCRYFVALVRNGERQARINPQAAHHDRASSALPVVAALFRTGKARLPAEKIQQARPRVFGKRVFLPIDRNCHWLSSITSIIIPLARTRRYRQTSAACRDSPDRPTLSSHDHSRQKGLGQSVVSDQMMRRQQ
jgi:hypothetical protein